MAASDKVPLTVTYTPTSGVTSTVTVLGQVLNNGATNWVPTGKDNAIVLETSSAAGEPQTVLDGVTYYITTGPALPDQVTLSTTVSVPASQTATSNTGMTASTSSPSSMGMSSVPSQSLSSPTTSSGSASPSKNAAPTGKSLAVGSYASKTGLALAGIFLIGAIWL